MKRMISMGLLLLIGATASMAQQKWSITPRVGINISDMTGGGDAENLTTKVGLTVGAEAEYRFTPLLGLSAGAFYSQQGSKADQTVTIRMSYLNLNVKVRDCKLDYLNVPVLLNVHVWQGLTLKAGLQAGYLLSAKSKTRTWGYFSGIYTTETYQLEENPGISVGAYVGGRAPEPTADGLTNPIYVDETKNQSIKSGMHKVDVALPVGLSYEYKRFVIDARYHFGLTKIESGEPSDKLRNSYASITLGYKF